MRESAAVTRMSMSNQDANARELRLWLLSATTHHGVTYYRIAGRFTSSGQTWEVSHRYSDFLKLRDQLVKFLSSSTDKCPGCRNYLHSIQRFDFPKKHLFASRAPIVVNYRVKALRSFINLLASWAFSKTPKCPTCGGFAFEVVRNFVLEGDDVSPDADMNAIRESVTVEAFAEHSLRSTRGGTHMRKNSWMMPGDPDMTQSMHLPRTSGHPGASLGPPEREAPAPRPSARPSQQQQRAQPQQRSTYQQPSATYERQQSTNRSTGRQPQQQQRNRHQDDDPYDAFNDYLPEKQSKVKRATQASMEQKIQSGKFASMPLQESIEERQRRHQQEAEEEANAYQQKLRKHRSEPRNLSARRPLAESELSVGTSAFESPHSSRRGASRGGSNAESFVSDVSMAAEPIFIHGDELQRYGLSDDERKARSAASSVYSGDDEIELTGVAMASPPRASKKSSNDNLWQPWELARGA